FFFSSRRRHTRFSRDWSSDVCSSDLVAGVLDALALVVAQGEAFTAEGIDPRNVYAIVYEAIAGTPANGAVHLLVHALAQEAPMQIGRASCRGRVSHRVVAGALRERIA